MMKRLSLVVVLVVALTTAVATMVAAIAGCDGNNFRSNRKHRHLMNDSGSPSASPTTVPSSASLPSSASPSLTSKTFSLFRPVTTVRPSSHPSRSLSPSTPNLAPSQLESQAPSQLSVAKSSTPSQHPSFRPSQGPSQNPSESPSQGPSKGSSQNPSQVPSQVPSQHPSLRPSQGPSRSPSQSPSHGPSWWETELPLPSYHPSTKPSTAVAPSMVPSTSPSQRQLSPAPKSSNIFSKTMVEPTQSTSPSGTLMSSTLEPTETPVPTSKAPSTGPSGSPSMLPSDTPTDVTPPPSNNPTTASRAPSASPSVVPSSSPSGRPSVTPSNVPSSTHPSISPSMAPNNNKASRNANINSSYEPSFEPSYTPSYTPSTRHASPSNQESAVPTQGRPASSDSSSTPGPRVSSNIFLPRTSTTPTPAPTISPYPSSTLMSSTFEPTETLLPSIVSSIDSSFMPSSDDTNDSSISTPFPSSTVIPFKFESSSPTLQSTTRTSSSPSDSTSAPTPKPTAVSTPPPSPESESRSPTSGKQTVYPSSERPSMMRSAYPTPPRDAAVPTGIQEALFPNASALADDKLLYNQCAEFLRNTYQLTDERSAASDSIKRYCSELFPSNFLDTGSPSSNPLSMESGFPTSAPLSTESEGQTIDSSAAPTKNNLLEKVPLDYGTPAEENLEFEELPMNPMNYSRVTPQTPMLSPTASPGTGNRHLVRVYNTWEMSNSAGLTASTFKSSSHFEVVVKAYANFIGQIISDLATQNPTIPTNRRHLEVSFAPERANIYKLIDTICPDSTPKDSRCLTAFGQADISTDESSSSIYKAYVNASQLAISSGELQKELEKLDAGSVISVTGTSASSSTEKSSSRPVNAPVEQSPNENQQKDKNTPWTTITILASLAVLALSSLLLLALCVKRRKEIPTEKSAPQSDESSTDTNDLQDHSSINSISSITSEVGVCGNRSSDCCSDSSESVCIVEDEGVAIDSGRSVCSGEKKGGYANEDHSSLMKATQILSQDSSCLPETFSMANLDKGVMERLGLSSVLRSLSDNESKATHNEPKATHNESKAKTTKPDAPRTQTVSVPNSSKGEDAERRRDSTMQLLIEELKDKLAARSEAKKQTSSTRSLNDDTESVDVESPESQTSRQGAAAQALHWANNSLEFSVSESDHEDVFSCAELGRSMTARMAQATPQSQSNSKIVTMSTPLAAASRPQKQSCPSQRLENENITDGNARLTWLQRGAQWIKTMASMRSSTDDASYETEYDTDDSDDDQHVKWVLQDGAWVRQVVGESS